MHRRAVLALLGSSVAGAGCTERLPSVARATGETARDGASDCPSFEADADRTVCGRRSGTVSLAAEADVFEVDPDDGAVESLRLTLRNESGATFSYGPSDWTLYRASDESTTETGWTEVASGPPNLSLLLVRSGGSVTYSLSPAPHPTPNDDVRYLTADLEPGRYAFALDGSLGGESAPALPGDTESGGGSGDESNDSESGNETTGDGSRDEPDDGEGWRVECVDTFRVEYA